VKNSEHTCKKYCLMSKNKNLEKKRVRKKSAKDRDQVTRDTIDFSEFSVIFKSREGTQ